MSTARKILSNTIAQVLGKISVALLGLAVVKISTSYLSVEGYGEYILVYESEVSYGKKVRRLRRVDGKLKIVRKRKCLN